MNAVPRGQQKFEIALELLSDHPATPAWGNLGDWTATTEYGQACRQLALRVGQAAKLQPQDHVLDLACGDGASLQLWPEVFGVRHVTGLEYRARCVDSIRRQAPACLDAIVQGRFDVLPAPAELPSRGFDAALCVDAAYHAASLDAFAAYYLGLTYERHGLNQLARRWPALDQAANLSLWAEYVWLPAVFLTVSRLAASSISSSPPAGRTNTT